MVSVFVKFLFRTYNRKNLSKNIIFQFVQNMLQLCTNKGGVIMPQIRPITDLRNTNEMSEICHSKKEPIFITKNGYGDMVLMSIETYEHLINEIEMDNAIVEAEAEYATGAELLDAREALASLKRKHFG